MSLPGMQMVCHHQEAPKSCCSTILQRDLVLLQLLVLAGELFMHTQVSCKLIPGASQCPCWGHVLALWMQVVLTARGCFSWSFHTQTFPFSQIQSSFHLGPLQHHRPWALPVSLEGQQKNPFPLRAQGCAGDLQTKPNEFGGSGLPEVMDKPLASGVVRLSQEAP